MFQTNPLGAKMDGQSFNEGQAFDVNWDGVWYVKSRIVEDGWVAEYAIPFKTVKFRGLDAQNFGRRNRRLNEESDWAPIPRIFTTSRVSLAGTLEGLQNVKPGSKFKSAIHRASPLVAQRCRARRRCDLGHQFWPTQSTLE